MDVVNGTAQSEIRALLLIYRTLHDLGEAPRTAFGENRANLSGVALTLELDPLLKKVQRKRLIRSAAYQRRNELVLRILEQHVPAGEAGLPAGEAGTGARYAPYRSRIVWGPLVPEDRSRLVEDERVLVAAGIHSRRRAADELGVADPESEFSRWLEEQGAVDARGEMREAGQNGRAAVGRGE